MKLGAFSVSLPVKDIHKSIEFYQLLGFELFAGEVDNNWVIMKSSDTLIGLFQGMFDKNMLTFNPGWDQSANSLEEFTDVRAIQQRLKQAGAKLISEVDENTEGPANLMLEDPDGNPILIDQHR